MDTRVKPESMTADASPPSLHPSPRRGREEETTPVIPAKAGIQFTMSTTQRKANQGLRKRANDFALLDTRVKPEYDAPWM